VKQLGRKFDLIVVSPLHRAIETALIILKDEIARGVPLIAHPYATEQGLLLFSPLIDSIELNQSCSFFFSYGK
jgi:hypothetical protein